MSHRIRAGLVARILVGAFVLVFSACGGLDNKKVIVHPDGTGGTSSGGDAGTGATNSGGDAGSNDGGGSLGADAGSGDIGGDAGAAGAPGAPGAAGAAGEGGLPPPVPGVPSVVSVSPRDTATGVASTEIVTLTFSEALDRTSVSTTSVQLKASSGAVVTSAVSYAASVVTLTPASRLNLLETYTVNVSTAVKGTDSTPMATPFTSSFSVGDGVWGKAEGSLTASTAAMDLSSQVQLASDGAGHAIAVWAQATTTMDVYAAFYTESGGWATPVKVNTNTGTCRYPYVAMNASGNAIVAWQEYDTVALSYSVQARRYYGGAWDPSSTKVDLASALPTTTYTVYPSGYSVAINNNGDAHVAWYSYYYDSSIGYDYYGMYARHVTGAGVWDAAVSYLQYSQQGGGLSTPSLAFDAAGNGFCAFQFTSSATPVKTSLAVERYVASTGRWGTSTVGAAPADGYATPVGVGVSPDGQAVLSWVRDTADTTYDVMGSYYNKAWSAPAVISNATTAVSANYQRPSGVVTWTGQSFWVTWAQSAGTPYNVYTNEYKAAWGTAQIISDGNHSTVSPFIAGDAHGNGLLVWAQQSDSAATATVSPVDIAFSRLTHDTDKWADPKLASSAVAGYRYPQVAFLGDGTAVAAWQRSVHNGKLTSVTGELQNTFR